MPRTIKNREYWFISTYGYGIHVGAATWYGFEIDKRRKKEGNYFESEEKAVNALKAIKRILAIKKILK